MIELDAFINCIKCMELTGFSEDREVALYFRMDNDELSLENLYIFLRERICYPNVMYYTNTADDVCESLHFDYYHSINLDLSKEIIADGLCLLRTLFTYHKSKPRDICDSRNYSLFDPDLKDTAKLKEFRDWLWDLRNAIHDHFITADGYKLLNNDWFGPKEYILQLDLLLNRHLCDVQSYIKFIGENGCTNKMHWLDIDFIRIVPSRYVPASLFINVETSSSEVYITELNAQGPLINSFPKLIGSKNMRWARLVTSNIVNCPFPDNNYGTTVFSFKTLKQKILNFPQWITWSGDHFFGSTKETAFNEIIRIKQALKGILTNIYSHFAHLFDRNEAEVSSLVISNVSEDISSPRLSSPSQSPPKLSDILKHSSTLNLPSEGKTSFQSLSKKRSWLLDPLTSYGSHFKRGSAVEEHASFQYRVHTEVVVDRSTETKTLCDEKGTVVDLSAEEEGTIVIKQPWLIIRNGSVSRLYNAFEFPLYCLFC